MRRISDHRRSPAILSKPLALALITSKVSLSKLFGSVEILPKNLLEMQTKEKKINLKLWEYITKRH